jgi:hypothetical protein
MKKIIECNSIKKEIIKIRVLVDKKIRYVMSNGRSW